MSLGFYFDNTRCMACKVCQIACKGRFDFQQAGPRPRRVSVYEAGRFPDAKMGFVSISCNHCENPACTAVCPTGAMYKDEDGTVQHDDEKCIGCKSCAIACPYGAPQYVEEGGIIAKCDSCRPLREAGLNPVCVDACPMRAIEFGDMDELRQKHGDDLVSELSFIPSSDLTHPNLLIKAKDAVKEGDFHEVAI